MGERVDPTEFAIDQIRVPSTLFVGQSLGPNPADGSLGLALSGGGFRATLFHLGVVRSLYDTDRLKDVSVITGVSGGSILASHLLSHWNLYTGTESEFAKMAKRLVQFCQLGIRERLIPRLLVPPFGGRTRILERQYELLFRETKLSEFRTSPSTYLLSANLQYPNLLFGFSQTGLWEFDTTTGVTRTIDSPEATIAQAVCASSAHPLLFPPRRLLASEIGATEKEMRRPFLELTDGGVFDNTGMQAMRKLSQEKPISCVVSSDASAALDWDHRGFRRVRRVARAANIIAQRQYDLEVSMIAEDPRCKHLTFRSSSTSEVAESVGVSHDVAVHAGRMRTDLNRFNDIEVETLIKCGYLAGLARVGTTQDCCHRDAINNLIQSVGLDAHSARQPVPLSPIISGRKTPLAFFSRRDRLAWSWIAVIATATLAMLVTSFV